MDRRRSTLRCYYIVRFQLCEKYASLKNYLLLMGSFLFLKEMSLHCVLTFHLSITKPISRGRLHETFSTDLLDPIVKVVVKGLFGVNDMNALSPHELRSRSNQRPTDSQLRLLIGTGVSSAICVQWLRVLCAGVAMVHGTHVYCYGNTT